MSEALRSFLTWLAVGYTASDLIVVAARLLA
jgi:hypothetical protein